MNEIIGYNEYHNNTDITGCNDDINNNEFWKKECNLNEIQPAPLPQDIYLNGIVDKGEEGFGKKKCICGSILLNNNFTNTRKYYDGDIQYFKIKNCWVRHTTINNKHTIFKSIIKYIFYKRRYNKLKKCVNIINQQLSYKNEILKEKNEKGKWVSVKGYTNIDFINKLKRMTRDIQMKIKNKGDEPFAPIRPPC